jgi:hypothetical protein
VIFGPWSEGAEVVLYHGRFEPKAELAFLSEIARTCSARRRPSSACS